MRGNACGPDRSSELNCSNFHQHATTTPSHQALNRFKLNALLQETKEKGENLKEEDESTKLETQALKSEK